MARPRKRSHFPPAAAAAAAALLLAAVFGLGVWWGQRGDSEHDRSAAADSAETPKPDSTVELRLDAGALTLLPEAGLELRPIPSLDLSANPAPTPSP
jgi:hypothetical protein